MFPFNWFPLREGNIRSDFIMWPFMSCFHSIGFPCERGTKLYSLQPGIRIRVSIQLVSPARGELQIQILLSHQQKFPFNWFPLREGNMGLGLVKSHGAMSFHSIGFPCERGTKCWTFGNACSGKFPFNWFPLREGNLR